MLSNLTFSVFHGSAFVASMYVLQSTSDNSRRDDWPVILKRMIVSSLFTGICYWISEKTTSTSETKPESLQKFFCSKPLIAVKMVGTLFCGVLIEWGFHYGARILRSRNQRKHNDEKSDSSLLKKMILRDLTIAPLTEEIVFRGSIHKRHLFAAFPSPVTRTLISAIIFSLAHVHHSFEIIEKSSSSENQSDMPKKREFQINKKKFINSAIPPLLFGLMSGVLVEKGVGILPLALAHSFCNLVGPPKWTKVVTNDEVVLEEIFGIHQLDDDERSEKILGIANKLFAVTHLCCIGGFVYQACVL